MKVLTKIGSKICRYRTIPSRPTRASAADQGVCPTNEIEQLVVRRL